MSIQHLHLPYEKVNPVGGAIALGHPLGCTGARQVATALSEAKREKKKVFVTSMCIGSGMVSDFVFWCIGRCGMLMYREWRLFSSMSSRLRC
jgi:acetyl-CoA acyltransferase 1